VVEENSRIDVLALFHNDLDRVDAWLDQVARTSVPIRLLLLDNASTDGTADALAARLPDLGCPARLYRSARNNGFARGVNLLFEQVSGEFAFLLNSDAEPDPDCIGRLLDRARSDAGIGICEARQAPVSHPKAVDPETGETTWCSGAAALVRTEAFAAVGGFDERLFFMYCEDIDLSWKMWLSGWKCVFVTEAVVEHPAGGETIRSPRSGRRRGLAHYFSFRNSIFIYYRFRRPGQWKILARFLLKRFGSRRYSFGSKALFAIAFVDHIRYIPYLLRTRRTWGDRDHPWIRLDETSLVE